MEIRMLGFKFGVWWVFAIVLVMALSSTLRAIVKVPVYELVWVVALFIAKVMAFLVILFLGVFIIILALLLFLFHAIILVIQYF
jgi:hypothetical protein